jgi:ubiquinone biosynthesis accessory factor UbiJ
MFSMPFISALSKMVELGKELPLPTPPKWLIDALQDRIILLVNHILQQEPQAMHRFRGKKNSVVQIKWRDIECNIVLTAAGLLNRADDSAKPDLTLFILENSPLNLVKMAMKNERPSIHIEGDVQLAAEINWMTEFVRWDIEEDLSRLIGDVGSHRLMQVGMALRDLLKKAVNVKTVDSSE